MTSKQWSLTAKTIGLVVLNILFVLAVGGIAVISLNSVGDEMSDVAEIDVPLLIELSAIGEKQLEQALWRERMTLATLLEDGDRAARARTEFVGLDREIRNLLQATRDRLSSQTRQAHSEELRANLVKVASGLENVSEVHDRYVREAQQPVQEEGLTAEQEVELERLESDLNRLATDLAHEVATFSAEAAVTALAHERAAVRRILFATIAALVIGVFAGVLLARRLSREILGSSGELQVVSQQMLSSVQQQSSSTNQTASAVAETTSTVDELRQTAEIASEKARQLAELADASLASSTSAKDSVSRGVESMRQIREEVEGIARNVLDLAEKNLQVAEIVDSVNAIAEQSNLLAVNASIEAAKAGELGRGFSVVADEVRALAKQSKQAAGQIRTILADTQKATNASVMVAEQGTKRVAEGAALIESLGQTLDQLAAVVEENADGGRHIAMTSQQQLAGVEQIVTAIRNIEDATRDNAEGARQLEGAAQQLLATGDKLRQVVHGHAA